MTVQTATENRPKVPSRLGRALGPVRGLHPVWGLNVLILAAAVALYAGPVHGLRPLARPHLPWWAIAIAFAVAERCVVHLHFRRGAHSFSLGDIPLVFGLIFCSAESFGIGCLLGCGLVLLFDRRLPPVKLVFNLGQLGLHACIALLVVHALAPVSGTVDTRTWISALIAAQISSIAASSLIAAAISLSEGLVRFQTVVQMLGMDLVVTTSNASLGLCGVVITAADVSALPLLLVPSVTLFAAYRAYLSERERHKRLEFLYEANRTLARSREIAHALEGLLVRSLEAFRAEMAEIILFGSEENPSLRTLLGPGNYRELMEPVDAEVADEMRHVLERGAGAITLDRPFGGGRLQRYLEARGVTHAMVAPLPGEDRVIGAIMLANRFGVVRSFDHEDLRLLDTLAGNASVALQYDRLEQAVTQLSVLQLTVHRQGQGDDRAAAPSECRPRSARWAPASRSTTLAPVTHRSATCTPCPSTCSRSPSRSLTAWPEVGREDSFVRMIIELARTLEVTVIAEGIETREQVSALVTPECDLGQGFYLGRPEPVRQELGLRSVA